MYAKTTSTPAYHPYLCWNFLAVKQQFYIYCVGWQETKGKLILLVAQAAFPKLHKPNCV